MFRWTIAQETAIQFGNDLLQGRRTIRFGPNWGPRFGAI
jgi:hypothetical protein